MSHQLSAGNLNITLTMLRKSDGKRNKLLRPSGSVQHFRMTYPVLYSVVLLGSGTYNEITKHTEVIAKT